MDAIVIALAGACFSAMSAIVGSLCLHLLARIEKQLDNHGDRIQQLELKVARR